MVTYETDQMSSADKHFSYPKYTQDEWDCAQASHDCSLDLVEKQTYLIAQKLAEIDSLKAEIATLKAQLAACTQDRDREPIR